MGLPAVPKKRNRYSKNKNPRSYSEISQTVRTWSALFECDGPFVVIHTVAKVTIGEGSKKELYDVTVKGTRNVTDACCAHGAKKLLHISSTEALPRGLRLKEDLSNYIPCPKRARKGYARAKSEADAIVLNAVKERGLNASLLLLAGVLGPGDYSNSHMSQMFIDYIEGRLPASIRGGYNDFDIRDVAEVLPAVVERAKKGESYIFANKPDTINDSLAVVSEMTGKKMLPTLPLWTAYVGLPFLSLAAKVRKKRPLYTGAALASIKEKPTFPSEKPSANSVIRPVRSKRRCAITSNFSRKTAWSSYEDPFHLLYGHLQHAVSDRSRH